MFYSAQNLSLKHILWSIYEYILGSYIDQPYST